MRSRGGKARGLVLVVALLGVVILAVLWLATFGADVPSPPAVARLIVAEPREEPQAPQIPVVDAPAAEPLDMVAPAPPAPPRLTVQSPVLATPGHASLDIVLVDERGRDAALGGADSLWLTKSDQRPGEPHAWQLAPDAHGHITTPDLPPGRYAGTLHTGLAGVVRRTDLVVTADQWLRAEFHHIGPPLGERIAVRIMGIGPSGHGRARMTDVVLHGPGGSKHVPWDAGGNVFLFDGLAAGRYDLELRRDGTESRWLHGLAPGVLREEWLELPCEGTQEFDDTRVFSGH